MTVIRIDAHHQVWELRRQPRAWLDGGNLLGGRMA